MKLLPDRPEAAAVVVEGEAALAQVLVVGDDRAALARVQVLRCLEAEAARLPVRARPCARATPRGAPGTRLRAPGLCAAPRWPGSHPDRTRCPRGAPARSPASRGVMAASSLRASIWNVSGSVSTKTGSACCRSTTLIVATNVYGGTITSSPGSIAHRVQRGEQRARAVRRRQARLRARSDCAYASSNRATFLPLPRYHLPLCSVSSHRALLGCVEHGPRGNGAGCAFAPPSMAGRSPGVSAANAAPASGAAARNRRRVGFMSSPLCCAPYKLIPITIPMRPLPLFCSSLPPSTARP